MTMTLDPTRATHDDDTPSAGAARAGMIERIQGLRTETYELASRQTLQILGIMITLPTGQTTPLLALL